MLLEVLRFSSANDDTLGLLFDVTDPSRRKFLCFTLEDEYRTQKVWGETRIPAGVYDIELRIHGGFHERYSKKFPDIHEGMLELQHVPNFKYVLIHIGNREDDTAACLLTGDQSVTNVAGENGAILKSTSAYRRVYPYVLKALKSGERVRIRYVDFDCPPGHEVSDDRLRSPLAYDANPSTS